jgi:hypothetical protein
VNTPAMNLFLPSFIIFGLLMSIKRDGSGLANDHQTSIIRQPLLNNDFAVKNVAITTRGYINTECVSMRSVPGCYKQEIP